MLSAALLLAVAPSVSGDAFSIPYEKYTLPENGLEVILSEDHALPIVAVNLWYHAGPINESAKRTGFAHLFEHLMFQGSKDVGDDQHFKLLDSSGASLINGTTDFDRTNYFETVPKNQLGLALWLESDRMGFLMDTLDQKKLDNQREVVMNERRQSVENVPYGPSDERMVQELFPTSHPYYGNVIGSMDDLRAATLDDVKAFYNRYYAPANATLVIAGDFDKAEAKALVQKYFATLPRRDAPSLGKVATPPLTTEKRVEVKEPVQLPRIQFGWISPPAFATGDADCDVTALILGAGKSSRLYKRLVYEKELAQAVSASQQSLALGSQFTITIMGRPGVDVKQLEAETQKVIDELKKSGPTEHEGIRAKNMLLTGMAQQLQNIGGFDGKADALNRYNQYLNDPGFLPKDVQRYALVTPATVRAQAEALLKNDARVVVTTVRP